MRLNIENQRRGFTLIELLVVIAIIALLLAILMPSLQAVKRAAQATVCLSNQKQIGMAADLYANDYEGRIPRGDAGGTMIWYTRFLPYIGRDQNMVDLKQLKIYRCGAFPKSGTGRYGLKNSRQIICYVVNAWEFNGSSDTVGGEIPEPTKLIKFRSPSSKLYLTDNEAGDWRPVIESMDPSLPVEATTRNDVFSSEHLPLSTNETDPTLGRRIARDRHSGGCNVLFLDWHAEKVKDEDVTMRMFRER
jgi:prepilin-type N-terminal cleavage/methylation domain-containing protein/prepilin-type processing-associated H-X9-DG protein